MGYLGQYPRHEWVRLYGRSFRRVRYVPGRRDGCLHEQAIAFENEPRKGLRYTVEVECGCGAREKYEMGRPLQETPVIFMDSDTHDTSVAIEGSYEAPSLASEVPSLQESFAPAELLLDVSLVLH